MKKSIEDSIDENGRIPVRLDPPLSGDNPWRTQGDYRREIERSEEMHAKLISQLEGSIRSSKYQTIATIVSVLALAVALLSFVFDAYGLKQPRFFYINRDLGANSYIVRVDQTSGHMCYLAQSEVTQQKLQQILSISECK